MKNIENTVIYEAKERYSGQLVSFKKQSAHQLEKSRKSFEKLIVKHKNWINNPISKVKNWNALDPTHQNNIIYHWKQDINRAEKYKKMAESELRSKYGR